MTDLHSHLLFDLDDGAEDLEHSLRMLEKAKTDGINVIAATSHFSPATEDKYQTNFEQLKIHASSMGIELHTGREYNLNFLADRIPDKLHTPGNSDWVLTDVWGTWTKQAIANVCFRLSLKGYGIIFAHPERSFPARSIDEILDMLLENQVIPQVNSGSLLGRYGSQAKANAFRILDRNGAYLLGNDAHREDDFAFSACRKIIEKKYGKNTFELLTSTNPNRILQNLPPIRPEL